MAQQQFTIAGNTVTAPTGWFEVRRSPDRLVLRSSDGHQQATISTLRLSSDATFDDFKKLCDHRLASERAELTNGFITPETPQPKMEGDTFSLLYSGGNKASGRVFSAYLTLVRRDLITVYAEGVGVAPSDVLASFRVFVSSLKRE